VHAPYGMRPAVQKPPVPKAALAGFCRRASVANPLATLAAIVNTFRRDIIASAPIGILTTTYS
jgi:hypothetical protein